jgi:hypothetical protein
VDLQKILSDLEAEKDRIAHAIEALAGMGLFLTGCSESQGPAQGRPTPWRNDAGSSEADISDNEEALGRAPEEDGVASESARRKRRWQGT